MISDRKQYIGIKNNIVFELFQFLFMLEWILACISHFSAHIPTSFSVFMPNICCLDKLDNKHYAYRLIMMWEYGQKNEKYWPGSIPAHIRIGKVLNVVIFDTNNCLFLSENMKKLHTDGMSVRKEKRSLCVVLKMLFLFVVQTVSAFKFARDGASHKENY